MIHPNYKDLLGMIHPSQYHCMHSPSFINFYAALYIEIVLDVLNCEETPEQSVQ